MFSNNIWEMTTEEKSYRKEVSHEKCPRCGANAIEHSERFTCSNINCINNENHPHHSVGSSWGWGTLKEVSRSIGNALTIAHEKKKI